MDLAVIRETVAVIDALLRDIADRPVDLTDPHWQAKLSAARPPVEEAGVAAEAAAALTALLDSYESGAEAVRDEVRHIFRAHQAFSWGVGIRGEFPSAAAEFRRRLLHVSARDQCADPRDDLVQIWELCGWARDSGVDVEPVLRAVADLSGEVDHFGMGSTRRLIQRGLERH
ncbi:hypothetical protein [Micromonospora chokoriensis]|uniref:Uncharacterized protein n=1 Tax=Micromonospora chokoriensis TaxID=356851 RepID=A0A1C4U2W6_9ACTN|nr:hypothetical protein [Micromonospora chokoriensis]SCE65969.1 hypothetical protein GA0070612_0031 [Micromonospora chokoriensis]